MYCTNCGSELKEGAKFCTGCGAPAEQAEDEHKVISEEQIDPQIPKGHGQKEKGESSAKKMAVKIVLLAAVIVASLLLIYNMIDTHPLGTDFEAAAKDAVHIDTLGKDDEILLRIKDGEKPDEKKPLFAVYGKKVGRRMRRNETMPMGRSLSCHRRADIRLTTNMPYKS